MNKRPKKPTMWLAILFSMIPFAAGAQAPADPDGLDGEGASRTRTWSIYAAGGLSWANGVRYESINAKAGYRQSPAAGIGVDFTFRPWIRAGAEYLWTDYRREQRPSSLDGSTSPVKAYGNYLMDLHDARLAVQFNLMELGRHNPARRFNIWAGAGAGCAFGRGNEYGIWFDGTLTQDGKTVPITGGQTVVTGNSLTFTSQVRTANRHEPFNKAYIPAMLHVEYDVSRQFTVGLRGEVDQFLDRGDIAPAQVFSALATVRYHFVPGRARTLQRRHDAEMAALGGRVDELLREARSARDLAAREASERARLQQENADLAERLAECEARKEPAAAAGPATHYVQFAHGSSYFSPEEAGRLKAFARSVVGRRLTLVAEASTPGETDYNQALSERRLARVVEALLQEGFAPGDLDPKTAIGEQAGKPDAEGRRATITVENQKP